MTDNRLSTSFRLLFDKSSQIFIPKKIEKVLCLNEKFKNQTYSQQFVVGFFGIKLKAVTSQQIVFINTKRLPLFIAPSANMGFKKKSEYFIVPSVYNPRWIIPSTFSSLGGMINPSSLKAKLAIKLFMIFSKINLGQIIFPHRIQVFNNGNSENTNLLDLIVSKITDTVGDGILYLGSYGPLQKTTFEFIGSNNKFHYAKISDNERTKEALLNENKAICFINKLSIRSINSPSHVKFFDINNKEFCVLTQSSLEGKKINGLSPLISNAIIELHSKTILQDVNRFSGYISKIENDLNVIDYNSLNDLQNESLDIAKHLVLEYKKLYKSSFVYLTYSHGDFTRWNILQGNSSISLFDWEEAKYRTVGYDLFHFLVIEKILVKGDNDCREFFDHILKLSSDYGFLDSIFFNSYDFLLFSLKLYFLDLVAVYLWHAAVHFEESYPPKANIDAVLEFAVSFSRFLGGQYGDRKI